MLLKPSEVEPEETKVKHLPHPEDMIFEGSTRFYRAYEALRSTHALLSGSDMTDVDVTVKHDGSPAVVFGYLPESDKFFVGTKAVFNKIDKRICHFPAEVNKYYQGELAEKLLQCLEYLPKVTPHGKIFQGDLMYTGEAFKQGEYVGFKPNALTYIVDSRNSVGRSVSMSKLGIAVHTQYHGPNLAEVKATHRVRGLVMHPHVHLVDSDIDVDLLEYKGATQSRTRTLLSNALNISKNFDFSLIEKVASTHLQSIAVLKKYANHCVRESKRPSTEDFKKYLTQTRYGAGGVIGREYEFDRLFSLHEALRQAKENMIKVLDKHDTGYLHFLGEEKTGPEGYVVHKPFYSVKLVNRDQFSKYNFLVNDE